MSRALRFRNSGGLGSRQLLVAGLVVVIAVAVGRILYTTVFDRDNTFAPPDEYRVKCTACRRDWAISQDELPVYRKERDRLPAGVDCPKCDAKESVFLMIQCPRCKAHYLPRSVTAPDAYLSDTARNVCPQCKTGLLDYYRERLKKR